MKSVAKLAPGLLLAFAGLEVMAQSAPVFEYRHITNPDATVICGCEHLGSQYDGICAAYLVPYDTNVLSWSWEPYGNAWLPYPETDDTAYYDSYGYGGLFARAYYVKAGFYYVNTETGERHLWWPTERSYAASQCGLGTVGFPL
ncbi:MAG: hypothetical protein IPK97_18220 [Ahniella sp.]|nr:hypothetical protein [Ahniella sp.]